MLEHLTQPIFAPHLNTPFRVKDAAALAVTLELVEVSEMRTSRQQEAFSLVFRGPSTPLLPQAMYRIEHDAIGSLDLFIVPIRRNKDGLCYEACFNRLRSQEAE